MLSFRQGYIVQITDKEIIHAESVGLVKDDDYIVDYNTNACATVFIAVHALCGIETE